MDITHFHMSKSADTRYHIFVCNISTDKNVSYSYVTNVRTLHILIIIRIFNGCELWIENSVTRVTVQHRETCRVMPNSYPEQRDFQFATNNHYGFFFLHTLFRQFHLGLNMYSFINFMQSKNSYIFQSRNVWFGSYLRC